MITVDQIMSWEPCEDWPRERVAEVVGDGLSPLEICDLDISAEDRLWVLLRPEVIPKKQLHFLACDFAERALERERATGWEFDLRSWEAVRMKRAWVAGAATERELAAARAAAWAAAWAAARAAAEAATWAGARDAAWAAARVAAGSAARAAAWAAARAAAEAAGGAAAEAAGGAAERQWQLEKIREVLNDHSGR